MKEQYDRSFGPEPNLLHPIVARILLLLFGMLLGAGIVVYQNLDGVQAAMPEPANIVNADGDIELCDPWKMAGGVLNYRCMDEDTGVVCYANGFGFLFCTEY